MKQTWEWAVFSYGETPTPAKVIAQAVGMETAALCKQMNRQGIAKYHRQGEKKLVRERRETGQIDKAITRVRHSEDMAMGVSLLRCGECGALSRKAICPNSHVINPFLSVAS